MAERAITVSVPASLYKLLEQRAKKGLMDINDLIVDILRRSMLSYRKRSSTDDKTDDSLVPLFSRKARKKGK
jgi:hypothetical protein